MPQRTHARKVAIVLFNLGGPDKPASVKPFLVNLFRDPAILRVPFFVRPFLARLIAALRLKAASANYEILGGKSPLLELTQDQARALEAALPGLEARCFVAMRYWHPFSLESARAVRDWDPDEVVLLPLYPQYSTTTTGSSLTAWRDAAARAGLTKPVTTLCCYHSDPAYLRATADIVRTSYRAARATLPDTTGLRILFSAHGLPEVIIQGGDPYQFQVERTVAGVVRLLAIEGLDHTTCYQSRATPQKWIEPSTEVEIERAAADKVAVLVVPIAFVSEHSETLVELDVEYRELAEKEGVPGYFRTPAQNSDPGFIAALAELVHDAIGRGPGLCSFVGGRTCPRPHADCPHARAAATPTPSRCPSPARGRLMDQPVALVIFDCDGVLVDSEGSSNRVVAQEITRLGWPMTEAEATARFIGFTLDDIPPVVEARLGRPVPDGWVETLRQAMIAAFDTVQTVPGALDAMRAVTALGIPFRVASNSSHEEMQVKFDRTGLAALVDGRRHSAHDVPRGKPAPDVFLAAAAAEGVQPAACLVLEDSIPGIRAAIAAGMRVVGLDTHGGGAALAAEGARPIRALSDFAPLLAGLVRQAT